MSAERRVSVAALLAKAKTQLAAIESEYESALEAKNVDSGLKVDIKNFFENLRSVLDYVAHEMRDSGLVAGGRKDRFYFPILPDESQFTARVDEWFPGLRDRLPELFDFLRSVQPFTEATQWIGQFNRVNNENKHGDLVEQTRVETERIEVASPGGGKVTWNPHSVRFGSGVKVHGVPIDPRTQLPVANRSVQTTRIVWVDFRFADVDVSAITLMRSALQGVRRISERVLELIDGSDSA